MARPLNRRQAGTEGITPEMIKTGAEIIRRAHGDAVIEGDYGSLGECEVAERVYIAMRQLSPEWQRRARRTKRPA
jgi:hypothetical protein